MSALPVLVDHELPIARLDLAGSPRVRASVQPTRVDEYAALMRDGVVFPPVIVFVVNGRYVLADGFHRVDAARQIGATTIAVTLHGGGSADDALWFALGANRHGHRLTTADKTHAVTLALKTWPTRSCRELAAQVGCSHQYMTRIRHLSTSGQAAVIVGRNGQAYPFPDTRRPRHRPSSSPPVDKIDKSRAAVAQRSVQMRTMAADGHTTAQMAAQLGLTREGCRRHLKRAGIHVHADTVTRGTRHPDANRIVAQMAMQAGHLCADTNLIDYRKLDPAQLPHWIADFERARRALAAFIRRLQEQTP